MVQVLQEVIRDLALRQLCLVARLATLGKLRIISRRPVSSFTVQQVVSSLTQGCVHSLAGGAIVGGDAWMGRETLEKRAGRCLVLGGLPRGHRLVHQQFQSVLMILFEISPQFHIGLSELLNVLRLFLSLI